METHKNGNHSIVLKHPADLRPHPKIKALQRWVPDTEDFNALVESVREHGFLVPAIVTPDGQVMDGETRRLVAKRLQLDLPCVVRPESELLDVAIGSEAQRRHITKSQVAWKYYPLIAEQFGLAEAALKAFRARPNEERPPLLQALQIPLKRVEEFASKIAVSPRLMRQCYELDTLFQTWSENEFLWSTEEAKRNLEILGLDPDSPLTLRAYYSPCIMHPDIATGLGAALAGCASKIEAEGLSGRAGKHGGGKPEDAGQRLKLFGTVWSDLENRFEYWTGFDAHQRNQALDRVSRTFTTAPEDLLQAIAKCARVELKNREAR